MEFNVVDKVPLSTRGNYGQKHDPELTQLADAIASGSIIEVAWGERWKSPPSARSVITQACQCRGIKVPSFAFRGDVLYITPRQ